MCLVKLYWNLIIFDLDSELVHILRQTMQYFRRKIIGTLPQVPNRLFVIHHFLQGFKNLRNSLSLHQA